MFCRAAVCSFWWWSGIRYVSVKVRIRASLSVSVCLSVCLSLSLSLSPSAFVVYKKGVGSNFIFCTRKRLNVWSKYDVIRVKQRAGRGLVNKTWASRAEWCTALPLLWNNAKKRASTTRRVLGLTITIMLPRVSGVISPHPGPLWVDRRTASTTTCSTEPVHVRILFIYLFIYCLPEIINVTITCKQVWGRTVRLTL